MPATVRLLPKFRRRLKRLRRKYPAVTLEVDKLITALEIDHRPGDKLSGYGYDLYKVRLPNPSARRGKSGGFRVVYYVQFEDLVHLVTIYSKSEEGDIRPSAVESILADIADVD
ncbi:MAG: type II toxin-antitoxin system RelE/ParE family toxin [Chloroflexota bacterium]|nr:type II toxin-antitoxin system RelE/ParE family toxin [Chloroflexota bacterium]